jgi:hypothetical protein
LFTPVRLDRGDDQPSSRRSELNRSRSRRAGRGARGDRQTTRGYRGITSSHLLQARDQPAETESTERVETAATEDKEPCPGAGQRRYVQHLCAPQRQSVELPLTPAMVGQLALEASSRNQRIGELARDLLQAVAEKGLIDEVLKQ